MKLLKRMICLTLVICFVLGCIVGCNRTQPSNDPSNPNQPGGPFRPDDPGVIAPLADDRAFPEDGVVWNMENIPDDLIETKWATPNWASNDSFVKDNVSILGVNGKGYQGSRALAVRQNGPYSWADIYTIGLKKDDTAALNWSSGEMLWVWYDSREVGTAMTMELELNGTRMGMGYPFFTMAQDENIAKKGGSTPEAYTGAGYGRIPLKMDYVGWVGVPLEAFGERIGKVKSIYLHVAYNGQPKLGGAVYFDNFCVTAKDAGPMGAGLSNESAKLATSDKPAWNMENIPNDLLASHWAESLGWNGYVAGNVSVLGTSGSGVKGSRALTFRQNGAYSGADVFSLNLTTDESAYTDWTGGEMLWFWMNTKGLRDDLRLDLWIDDRRPAVGTPYYGIGYDLTKQQAGTLPKAWDGADYGRITIGANYAGWVGIPLSAYGSEITDIINVQFHLAYSGDNSKGRTVYFDEFWITKANEVPKTASGASVTILRGGIDGIDPDVGPKLSLPAEVWSMEGLPSDPVASDMIYAEYPNHESYRAGNVTFARAVGKGYEGSNALQIKQNGHYEGIDIFKIDLSRDATAKRNWAGGKMLWLWMDTSEMPCGVKFDLWIDGARPIVGAEYYTVAEGDSTATQRFAAEAWTGGGYGRFALSPGFTGWVGIPFTAFPNGLSSASLLELHIAYAGEPEIGKSVYIDSFWVRDDEQAPNGVSVTLPEDKDLKWSATAPVWDMEKLPANLQTSGWASADYDYDPDYRLDNTQYLGADGQGRKQTRALEARFNGSYSWADVYTLNLKADSTAKTDWTGGEMLWFFVNAKSLGADVELELVLQGKKINAGAGYYTVQDGACVKKGELITAWDGNGRVPVEAGYVGWLGLPLSGYGKTGLVRNITLHIAGNGVTAGASLYLDELWITAKDGVPVGAENGYIDRQEPGERDDLPLEVWSVENVPSDPLEGIVVPAYSSSGDYKPGNVTIKAVDGKGHNGSRALSVTQNGDYCWADVFTLMLNRDTTAVTDWAGGKMLWLWTDASAFSCDINMDFKVDGRTLVVNESYYTAQPGGEAQLAGKLQRAWDGANYARIPIAAGYVGWIGIPFSAFVREPVTAKTIEIHAGYSDNNAAKGKTFYLDAFTLTDDTTGPDGITIPKKDPAGDRPATPDKAAWDMENLPDDLLKQAWAGSDYASNAEFIDGNVQLFGADGKGRNGSRALEIRQNGGYSWPDVFTLDMNADDTFCNNWTGSEMLMFWADASEANTHITLELLINDSKPSNTASYYLEKNGKLVKAGTLPDAWGGSAGYGRIPVPAGFKGWIGIPLSAYGGVKKVEDIRLHLGYAENDKAAGSKLYLDEFWVFSGTVMPAGTPTGSGGDEPEPEITTILNEDQPTTPESYVNVDPSKTYQTVKAYGVSDCWWTNGIGTREEIDELLALFFTNDGIALNNYRINVGASVKSNLSDGPTYEADWRAVLSPLDENGKLDITRNAGGWNALNTLRALAESGKAQIDDYTLFMNSPPSSMTENGMTCNDKLRKDSYTDYAKYVADVVEAYQKAGITVKYVSPINEPMMAAWVGNTSQENCIYTVSEIIAVYEACIDELDARGLAVKLSIADFANWNDANSNFAKLMASEKIASHIDHLAAHDYGGSAAVKTSVYEKASAKNLALHMSEWCMAVNDKANNMDTALELAEMLCTDMTTLNVETWSWWTGVGHGGYSDSLIYVNNSDSLYEVTKRFWAYGNYSKFTKGYTRTELLTEQLAEGVFGTAYTKQNGDGTVSLVYVLGNKNAADTPVTLAGLPAGAKGRVHVTSDNYDCEQIGYIKAENGYSLPARSVVTLVFDSVDPAQISSTAAPSVALPLRVADMEGIAADLFTEGGASSYFPQNVGAGLAEGKGFNDTNALGYVYKNLDGGNYWGNSIRLQADALGCKKLWSGAEMLWFWVDASEFGSQLNLDLWLNDGTDFKTAMGAEYYTWSGTGTPVSAGTIPEAWGGAGYGRIPLAKGYKGFIGLPMTAFDGLNTANIKELYLYIEPNDDAGSLPKTLYFDEFWLTAKDGTPAVTPKPSGVKTTVVWDMEQLTDVYSMAKTTWSMLLPGTYIDGVAAAGKGANGSSALGYKYVAHDPNGDGANFLLLAGSEALASQGFQKDWSAGKMLWFWVDAREFSHSVYLDLWLNWARSAVGSKFYLWDGVGQMTEGGTLPDAWGGGAGYGRIPLPAGYCGYIGLRLADFTVNTDNYHQNNIDGIFLYYETTDELPKTLYFDNFLLTDDVEEGPTEEFKARRAADMESIAADLFTEGGASSYFPQNVGAGLVEGKGFNATNALGYVYKNLDGGNYWGNSLRLQTAALGIDPVWSGAEMLWFWVDASEFGSQLNLDLWLNDGTDFKTATGTEYYTWSGTGAPVSAGTIPEAWGGAGYGRIPLARGYKGFIGLPMSAFAGLNTANVKEIYFYIEPNSDAGSLPKTLYIDELWLTARGGTPDVTPVAKEKYEAKVVFDMETLPEDLYSILQTTWSSVAPGERIDGVAAAGKGVGGSTAFGYRWVNQGDGNDFLRMVNLGSVPGYKSDWSGAKMVWFWVDTTEFSHSVNLDIFFNWARPVTDSTFYLWDGENRPMVGGTIPLAWGGATYGRIPIPQGYSGYVGLNVENMKTDGTGNALSSFLGSITEFFLYYETTDELPKTLYIDNIAISDQLPE